jgi:hypothetical protein
MPQDGVVLGNLIVQSPANPGLASWGIFSRPFGTDPLSVATQDSRPGLLSAVPTGLRKRGSHPDFLARNFEGVFPQAGKTFSKF